MKLARKSGILLHLTSLPSRYGIGGLGKEAFEFIDFLERSGQKLWQILPIHPVGYGESPYQSFSAFAGNTLLIDIDLLVMQGLLTSADIGFVPSFDEEAVEFTRVSVFKERLFKKAFESFRKIEKTKEYKSFIEENSFWLEEFSLFMALKEYFGGLPWNEWEKTIAFRKKEALEQYRKILNGAIEYHSFLQYIFFVQWKELKKYAGEKGIEIIGDMPIFISYDSSDAWSRPELFELGADGRPLKVAGVPPDYFSTTGQYWGNPHYRWDRMASEDFAWWRKRLEQLLKLVDIVRIDHFRGFESYWEIPGDEKNAVKGRWVKAPGKELFEAIRRHMGELPIIAEDLGVITDEVRALKEQFGFPGMKILQFAFGGGTNESLLPRNYEENCIVYTGTHDNDTILGWYRKARLQEPEAVDNLRRFFGIEETIEDCELCLRFIEMAFESSAVWAIIPLQDILCIGSQARMNIPNTIGGGNWKWRFRSENLTKSIENKLYTLSKRYKRI